MDNSGAVIDQSIPVSPADLELAKEIREHFDSNRSETEILAALHSIAQHLKTPAERREFVIQLLTEDHSRDE